MAASVRATDRFVLTNKGFAEQFLERADLLAHGARRDVKLLGGSGEADAAGNRLEGAQRTEGRQGFRHPLMLATLNSLVKRYRYYKGTA